MTGSMTLHVLVRREEEVWRPSLAPQVRCLWGERDFCPDIPAIRPIRVIRAHMMSGEVRAGSYRRKIALGIRAWMPLVISTTCVTTKSRARLASM
jgi:hypothetical protein